MKKIAVLIIMVLFCSTLLSQEIIKTTDGVTEKLNYDNNQKLNGKCLAWNTDSVLIAEANYLHGVKHGVWKIWYDNGQLAYEMYYSRGEKVGTWKQWDEKGVLINEKKYR